VFNILSYKGNANQNAFEISCHLIQNAYHQEQQQMLATMQGEMDPYTWLVGK
jgi:hypothetical protein